MRPSPPTPLGSPLADSPYATPTDVTDGTNGELLTLRSQGSSFVPRTRVPNRLASREISALIHRPTEHNPQPATTRRHEGDHR